MKIDGDKLPSLNGLTEPADRADKVSSQNQPSAAPSDPPRGDQIHLSADWQLVRTALDSASRAPASRGEVVERMRRLVAEGRVGNDPARLADAIIDTWLNSQ